MISIAARSAIRASSTGVSKANDAGADVVVFPELASTGYPPRDLLEKQSFLDRTEEHLMPCRLLLSHMGPVKNASRPIL